MRVLHLVGSPTDEFFADLSRLYARDCLEATADPGTWEPVIAYVSPDGCWRFPASLAADDLRGAPALGLPDAVAALDRLRPDVAVPQLFCRAGMTTYRALLVLLDIPYVGNRPEVMALGADKPRAKAVVAAAGVDVPQGVIVRSVEDAAAQDVPLPAVVKPADADNSDGLSLVREPRELAPAIQRALEHSDVALVERYVELGREVRCGVLERDGKLVVLPLEEYAVDPASKPVRDAADKLARHDGELALVAKDAAHAWTLAPDDPIVPAVAAAARTAHVALGCRHYSLFDFRIDPAGRPWFLEAGLYCSFARGSVIATMAAAAGIDIRQLFADSVDLTLGGTAPQMR